MKNKIMQVKSVYNYENLYDFTTLIVYPNYKNLLIS